jgi:hypothetical protein
VYQYSIAGRGNNVPLQNHVKIRRKNQPTSLMMDTGRVLKGAKRSDGGADHSLSCIVQALSPFPLYTFIARCWSTRTAWHFRVFAVPIDNADKSLAPVTNFVVDDVPWTTSEVLSRYVIRNVTTLFRKFRNWTFSKLISVHVIQNHGCSRTRTVKGSNSQTVDSV